MKNATVCILDLSHSMATRFWEGSTTTRLESARESLLKRIAKLAENKKNECSVILLQTQGTSHHQYDKQEGGENARAEIPFPHLTELPTNGITTITSSYSKDLTDKIPNKVANGGEKKQLNGGDFAHGIILAEDALTKSTCDSTGKPLEGWKRSIVLWTDADGYDVTVDQPLLVRACSQMQRMDCSLYVVGLGFQHVETETFPPASRAARGGENAPDDEESESSSKDETAGQNDEKQPVSDEEGEQSDDEESEDDDDASEYENEMYYTGTHRQQDLLRSIVKALGGMILSCSSVNEMGRLERELQEVPNVVSTTNDPESISTNNKDRESNDDKPGATNDNDDVPETGVLAMSNDDMEEMIVNGLGGGGYDNEEANTGNARLNGGTFDNEQSSDDDDEDSHASSPPVATTTRTTTQPPPLWRPVRITHEEWMDEIQLRLPDLVLEPLSGFDLAVRLNARMQDVVTKFLPCADMFCTVTNELTSVLSNRAQTMHPLQIWATYLAPLPKGFEFKYRNIMDESSMKEAIKKLKALREEAENDTEHTTQAMCDRFLGGSAVDGSWGLHRWLCDHGTTLKICTEIDIIMCAVGQTMNPQQESTKKLARLCQPVAVQVRQRLLDQIPLSFQVESLPYFGRIKASLEYIVQVFEAWLVDNSDSDMLEIVESVLEEESKKEADVIEISDDGGDIDSPIGASNGRPPETASIRRTMGNRIEYSGPAEDRSIRCFLQTFRPSKLTPQECSWVQVINPSSPAQHYSLQIEQYRPFLQKIESQISLGKRVPKAMKDECKASIHATAKAAGYTTGKWMLFCRPENCDMVWNKVATQCVLGELGCSAKIAPAKFIANDSVLCCVYVKDSFDIREVKRVLHALQRILEDLPAGSRPRLSSYKPDIYTDLGIYQKNEWRLDPVLYKADQVHVWGDEKGKNENKRKNQPENDQKPVARKRSKKSGSLFLNDDTDSDDEENTSTVITESSTMTRPASPLEHPCPNPKYIFQSQDGETLGNFCVYVTFREDPHSPFWDGLEQCHKICTSFPSGDLVHNHCFQRDGTRHVTMNSSFGVAMTWEEARRVQYTGKALKEFPVRFDGFQPWSKKGVHLGVYLKVEQESQDRLRRLFGNIAGWPAGDKVGCDHMSIYRYRKEALNDHPAKTTTFGAINTQLAKHDWGVLTATSIRIKSHGSEYDECKVLAGT